MLQIPLFLAQALLAVNYALPAIIAGIVILVILLGIMAMVFAAYGTMWFQAYMSSADVSIWSLIGMGFRQVNPRTIITAKVMATQAGLDVSRDLGASTARLEAHFLAGGNVMNVVHAIIAAHRARIPLEFDQACAIDLAGRDIMDAVRTSVNPKVIDCPDPRSSRSSMLSAIARNGVELKVRAKVTVRTNLEQLIGGATEDTIIARVGEGMITAIGSAKTHLEVLACPEIISTAVLDRGLGAHTAFEIVSIDISDIDVGENIGARLQADQAEADTRVARAHAEQRRAEAIATEQEMKAKVAENRARLVLAEADVPRAMGDAFRRGNMTLGSA